MQFYKISHSQPVNNDCSGAIPIEPIDPDSSCSENNFVLPFNLTTSSGVPFNCAGFGKDQWFSWIATTNALKFVAETQGNPSISIFGGCEMANSGQEITCINYVSNLLYGWEIGDTVLIQIHTNSVSDVMTFCLKLETQLSNDLCSGAIPIIPTDLDSSCSTQTHYLNFESGLSYQPNSSYCGVDNIYGQWFYWHATEAGLRYKATIGSPGIEVFENCIKASQNVALDCVMPTGNPKILSGWNVGDTILMRIVTYLGTPEVEFCLEIEELVENNNCQNAVPIIPTKADSGCQFTTFLLPSGPDATTYSGVPNNCGNNLMRDQWFFWKASTEALRFWSSSAGISIYSNCSDAHNGVEIDCCRSNSGSKVLSGWQIGDTLKIQIHSEYENGDIGFCLEEESLVQNNDCSGAIPIDTFIQDSCNLEGYSILSFTQMGTTHSGALNDCGYVLDQWFTWIATSDAIRFNTGFGNPGITVYADCNSALVGNEIICVYTNKAVLSGWNIGDTLLVQIFTRSNAQEISFCLERATLIENDLCSGAKPIYPLTDQANCGTPHFTIDFSLEATTNSGIPETCDNYELDQWFYWISTADVLRFTPISGHAGMTLFQNCNAANIGDLIDCSTGGEENIFTGWNVGDTLILQFYPTFNFSNVISFFLKSDTLVENNTCSSTSLISPVNYNSSCENPQFFIPFEYEASIASGVPENCYSYVVDQWFTWVANSDALRFSKYSGSPGISIFQNCQSAESGEEIICISPNTSLSTLSGWSLGDTLIIQIYSSKSDENVSFCLEMDTLALNNSCFGAVPIFPSPPDSGCEYPRFVLPIASSATTRSGVSTNCGGNYFDQWFTWTATSEALRFWSISPGDLGIAIYHNCSEASANNSIDCSDLYDMESALFGWNVGDSLLIQMYSNSISRDLFYCLEEESIALNDDCSNAIPILPSSKDTNCIENIFSFSFNSSVTSPSNAFSECAYMPIDLWYQWVATTDALRYWPQELGTPGISIYSNCLDAELGNEIDCSGNQIGSYVLSGWDIGDTLVIQIFINNYSNYQDAAFCLQKETLAINDNCFGAVPIEPWPHDLECSGQNFIFSLEAGATTFSDISTNCSEDQLDRWFRWRTSSDALRFYSSSSCNAGIAVYLSCSEALLGNDIDCDYDAINSSVISGWNVGDELLIQVFCSPDNINEFTFCLEKENLADNNYCINATPLGLISDTSSCGQPNFNISFVDHGVTYSDIPYGCSYNDLDLWFSWYAASDELVFTSFSPEYPIVTIFSSCSSAAQGDEISCGYTGANDITLAGWALGDNLLIQVSVNEYYNNPTASFCLKSAGNLLPVELTDLEAEYTNPNIHLTWTTASEINNDRFEIEKSSDGVEFKLIGSVPGHINSSSTNEYNFIDESPFHGLNYYRLKQVDRNGAFEYSNIVSVKAYTDLENELLLYPNPLSKERIINIRYTDLRSIKIFNSQGQIVYVSEFNPTSELIPLNLEKLSNGYYILEANDHIRTSIILH